MTGPVIIFFVLAALAVLGAVSLILQRHPIHSALSLIVVMVALAGLYLLMGAEFVAAVQIIVYGGAIMVLFVFVIMLLNAGEEEVLPHSSRVAIVLGVPGLILGLAVGVWVVARYAGFDRIAIGGPQVLNGTEGFGNPSSVAKLLFRDYLLPFEVTSVLVLIAILGAVVLARREE